MKQIVWRLFVISILSALVFGSTIAFFSDMEKSSGNTFSAGGIDLKIDSLGAKYNGELVPNSSWFAKDLTSEKFFYFEDVKPGDYFHRNISLHVENNPAWVCLFVKNKQDDDNGLTEPEVDAGDQTDGMGEGELSQYLQVKAWRDDNDTIHQNDEPFLIDSFFANFTYIPIADSTTGTGPLDPSIPAEIIAIELCAGTQSVDSNTGAISCNGSSMDNIVQTDILTADISLYVEQYKNNLDFKCSDVLQD